MTEDTGSSAMTDVKMHGDAYVQIGGGAQRLPFQPAATPVPRPSAPPPPPAAPSTAS